MGGEEWCVVVLVRILNRKKHLGRHGSRWKTVLNWTLKV
jgi:hypothetical protein